MNNDAESRWLSNCFELVFRDQPEIRTPFKIIRGGAQ